MSNGALNASLFSSTNTKRIRGNQKESVLTWTRGVFYSSAKPDPDAGREREEYPDKDGDVAVHEDADDDAVKGAEVHRRQPTARLRLLTRGQQRTYRVYFAAHAHTFLSKTVFPFFLLHTQTLRAPSRETPVKTPKNTRLLQRFDSRFEFQRVGRVGFQASLERHNCVLSRALRGAFCVALSRKNRTRV